MSNHSTALITPSYSGDYERCRLLCDSVDRFVEDRPDHFILVDDEDYALFSSLSGSKRHVINELDILPVWLHNLRPLVPSNARKLWWSTKTWPMRGWHIQQLRRIAIAHHLSHDGLLYCDSDMLFVRPFSTQNLWRVNDLRLYRKKGGIHKHLPGGGKQHMQWTRFAAELNGVSNSEFPANDYINNLVSWRREHVLLMCDRIETHSGKHWLASIGSKRSFSECQIYGAFADKVLGGAGHWAAEDALCQTYWSGNALNRQEIEQFVGAMSANQVAIGIQSFTETNPELLRELIAA